MLRLEKVNGKNVWELLKLKVAEYQKDFVAPNDVSVIEAYTAVTGNGQAFPFGIYDDDIPVGFLMIGYDVDDDWDDAPQIARGYNASNTGICNNSWTSLVAKLVKNPPVMQETVV